MSELLKKTPNVTNIWSAATNPPASLPAAAATSTSTDQPTASTISADTTDGYGEEPGTSSQSQVCRDEPEDLGSADSEAVAETEISRDVACWGKVNEAVRSYWVGKGVMAPTLCQNKDADFSASERTYKSQKRCLSKTLFTRTLRNREKVPKEWLVYSPSTGNVYCFFCKLFGNGSSAFTHSGYSDWKHSVEQVEMHKAGQSHRNATLTWLARTQVRGIDAELLDQFRDEASYWREVLRRIVAVIMFLSERGLAFRAIFKISLIRERHLQSVFPNVDIALRIYLTLPVSNASGERSFSKLGIIKHRLRTSMCEDRLNNLTLMSIEHDILRQLDFEELIDEFALRKSRKRAF